MKKLYFVFLVVLGLLINVNANAQTNVTSSGMSIQGIARDETNAAIANIDQLALTFTVYYLEGVSEKNIVTRTANVRTDNFGVFSYVLDIDQTLYGIISSQSAYLKVMQGGVTFSNEKLQAVPYSIFAYNGVPTGSIMPFVGTEAPNGWLLCNGSSFASLDVAITANLKALLGGTNTPDLKGIFLRGTGRQCNAYGCYEGPELKAIQQDDLKSHLHAISIPTTSNGSHSHSIKRRSNPNNSAYDDGDSKQNENSASTTDRNDLGNFQTSSTGNHTHTANGNSNSTGGSETRPINYGVNYIIKL